MFDGISTLAVAMWATVGAFLGSVVTPVLAEDRRVNGWALTLAGTAIGAIGSLVLLIPLWVGIKVALPASEKTGPAWRRDALAPDEIAEALAPGAGAASPLAVLPLLRDNFWPKARPAGEHSHRLTYVGVAIALAVITAIEVVLSVLDNPGFSVVGPLVALSTAKVMLVVLYFMHLRYDSRWYAWIFAGAMPFAALVMVVLALS